MADAPITRHSSVELLAPGVVVVNHRGDGYVLARRDNDDVLGPGWVLVGGGFISDRGLAEGPWSVSGDPEFVAKVKARGPVVKP